MQEDVAQEVTNMSPEEYFKRYGHYPSKELVEAWASGPQLRRSYPNKFTEFVATNPMTGLLVPGAESFLQKGGSPSGGDLAFGLLDVATGPIPAGAMLGSIIKKKGRDFWRRKKQKETPTTTDKAEVHELPEQSWVSEDPEKDVIDLLEDHIRLEEFDKVMPEEVVLYFDGVHVWPNYIETAADAASEKIRFSKYLDMVRDQMVKDGLVDPSAQARAAYKFYAYRRAGIDVTWAAEQSGGELGNKLRVSLDEWRDLTFLKGDDEIEEILSRLRRKK
jgi:hypothetical protein